METTATTTNTDNQESVSVITKTVDLNNETHNNKSIDIDTSSFLKDGEVIVVPGVRSVFEFVDNPKKGEANIKVQYLQPVTSISGLSNQTTGSKRANLDKADKALKKQKLDASEKMCPNLIKNIECTFGDKCKFSHDKKKLIESKPPSLGKCIFFERYGTCKYGINCLFGGDHIVGLESVENKEKVGVVVPLQTMNECSPQIQTSLRDKKYKFIKSDIYFKENNIDAIPFCKRKDDGGKNKKDKKGNQFKDNNKDKAEESLEKKENLDTKVEEEKVLEKEQNSSTTVEVEEKKKDDEEKNNNNIKVTKQSHDGTEIEIEIPLKQKEKKTFDFRNQLILAPLTTVGNLPFRRLCKKLGADVTVGEMALTKKILEGQKSELALMKRHPSEDKFGVQICGSHVDTVVRTVELIENEMNVDFVDINSGCPIDLICNMGAGAAMMDRTNLMQKIVRGASTVLSCPLTIKIRVGKLEDSPNAHKIIPNLGTWGASAVTLHGRSKTQRYTKLANWDYIYQCANVANIPLIGNGDIYNFRDAVKIYDNSKVSSLMVARGALIKPWVFTEIKEKRDWDISATERLDYIREYVNFGLDHWGSDQQGVDNTRKFLLNWLSFAHRYVPVGILESVHKMNERPAAFYGRNELETLLSSPHISDWIKISEMFLGKVGDNFSFIPKHNSNSYEAQG
eukprot:gene524-662_t